MSLVYPELKRIAHRRLRRERPGHTLQTTALIHEAYLRLAGQENAQWRNRAHFLAVSGEIMRRILVDYARAERREKRGGGAREFRLNEEIDRANSPEVDIVALDDALHDLAKLDPQQSRVVELRFFAGLSIDETAEALGISKATANRDWVSARAWLLRELGPGRA